MSVATGSKSGLCFKEETAYGTAPTGNWEQMTFNSESLLENINAIKSNEINLSRTLGTVRGGNISAGGNVQMDFHAAKLGLWFKHTISDTLTTAAYTVSALAASVYVVGAWVSSATNVHCCIQAGTVTAGEVTATLNLTAVGAVQTLSSTAWMVVGTVAAISANAKTHTITGAPGFPVGGIAIEKAILGGNNPGYFPFLGNRVNSLTINIPQEGIITCDFAMLGLKVGTVAGATIAGTPVTVSDDPFVGYQSNISVNSTVSTIVESASLTINNNLDANVFTTNSRYRKDLTAGRREISGRMSLLFETLAEYTLFKNETKIPVFMSFIHEGKFVSIDLPECKFVGGQPTPAIAGNGTVKQSFEFTAFMDTGSYDIRIILRNIVASY